jgi:phosphonate transport system substrate-binding protein
MRTVNTLVRLATLLVAALLLACEPAPANKPLQYSKAPATASVPVYRLAIHPLYNPQMLSAAYQPLVDHLNAGLTNARLELEASRDYQAFEAKYTHREPDFLLPNPWQTLQAMKVGYQVIAMAGDAQDFKGIFIVRRDSGIKTPADLKGKVVSYPSHTALAAAIMPQYFLYGHGINVTRDIQNAYVGSQESSILNVYLGMSAAGATWPPPWRLFQKNHPKEAADLHVIWETEALINNSVMVRDDVPEAVREQVKKVLFSLAQHPSGMAILEGMSTAGFYAADDASYGVVERYISRFEQVVRPVSSP